MKLIFKNKSKRTEKNPYNQVGLHVFKVWGRESHECLADINNNYLKREIDVCKLDATLIGLGMNILTQNFWENYYNDQLYPAVDFETKDTIRGMVERRDEYIKQEDFELVKRISDDINKVLKIGAEIFELQQALENVLLIEDYTEAQIIKERLKKLMHYRDNFDAKYQTFRFENMILMDPEYIKDYNRQLERDLEVIRRMREEEERKKILIDDRSRMGKSFYRDDLLPLQLKDSPKSEKKMLSAKKELTKSPKPILNKKIKSPELKVKNQKEELFETEGDRKLSKYIDAALSKAGIARKDIKEELDKNTHSKLTSLGILDVFGNFLWTAVKSGNWKARKMAADAVLGYIKQPIDSRFKDKSYKLFLGCCEIANVILSDKVREVSIVGLKILQLCFDPPICDDKITTRKVSDALNELIPVLRNRIAEKNKITSEMNFLVLLDLLQKPCIDLGYVLERNILDICEKEKDGRVFYKKDTKIHKMAPNILLPRLNILTELIKKFSVVEQIPPYFFMCFDLLVLNCLQHTDTDVKDAAFDAAILYYQINSDKVKTGIESLVDINPHYRQYLENKFMEADHFMEDVKNGNQQVITTEKLLQPTRNKNVGKKLKPKAK